MEIISSYINLIRKEIEGLKLNHSQYFDAGILVAFRGEPSDYGQKKLMPSLFRNLEYLKKEHHLFELLCDFNFVSNNSSNIEKAIEAQHYTAISRMLDISFNSLVALYFACENKANENNNGYIFIFAFPEHYSPHSKYIEDFYTYMLDGRHIPYSKNFKVFSHSYSNDRIKAQKGGFIFFPGTDYYPINECYYRKICIKQQDKQQLLDDLDMLFSINDASIFPEKDKIAKVAKEKFGNHQYLSKAVSVEDEIETYFNRISYELKLINSVKKNGYKKETLRLLRKEQADITNYFKSLVETPLFKDVDEAMLVKKIEDYFKILSINYREA